MIKLLTLSFEGIGRFTKKQTVDFSDREKLIQIDGKNENTGGSSGAGKSTIFNALDYLLGLNDTPATALQSRITKTSIYVEGVFDIDGKKVVITRSKKDGLSISSEEETISGNVKLAEERLEQIIGIPKKLFKRMIHKKQKEGGFFLNLTAKESFEFLIKVLGLENWTTKIEKIDEDIKTKQKRLEEIQLQVNNKKEHLENLKGLLKTKTIPTKPEKGEVELQHLSEEKNNLKAVIDGLKTELNEKVSAIKAPGIHLANPDNSKLLVLKSQLTDIQNQIHDITSVQKNKLNQLRTETQGLKDGINKAEYAEKELTTIVQKIHKLKEQQKHIESATCPTCTQSWTGKGAVDKIKEITDEIGILTEKAWEAKQLSDSKNSLIDKYQVALKTIEIESSVNPATELEAKLNTLRAEAAKEEASITSAISAAEAQNKLAQAEYNGLVQSIKNEYNEKINKDSILLNSIESEIKLIELNISNYKKSMESFNREMDEIISKRDLTEAQIIKLDEELKKIMLDTMIAEEAKKAIKAYTLQIFQESLDYIGEQASQILSNIPNMANASIYFESCKETKSGSIKDEVNPIINMDGENEVSIKTLSGGERTSIDLAVDLAVIDMIETKAGKGADFFVLDEPFDGLDSRNKTECLEILQNLDTNKKIIIVDHSSELKAMVHDVITVVRQGEESFVV